MTGAAVEGRRRWAPIGGFVLAFVLGLTVGSSRLHLLLVISAVYSMAGTVTLLVALRLTPMTDGRRARESGRPGATGWPEEVADLRRIWSDASSRAP